MSDSGYGHDDISCMTYDIHVDTFTWMCMGWFDHYMSTKMGSNPCRRLSLLGFAHPVVGSPFQVHEKAALLRGHVYEEGRVVALRSVFVKYIRII